MIASDIMTRKVYTIHPEASAQEAAQLLSQHRISGLPVVNADNKIIGMVTEADIISKLRREGLLVSDIMTPRSYRHSRRHARRRDCHAADRAQNQARPRGSWRETRRHRQSRRYRPRRRGRASDYSPVVTKKLSREVRTVSNTKRGRSNSTSLFTT